MGDELADRTWATRACAVRSLLRFAAGDEEAAQPGAGRAEVDDCGSAAGRGKDVAAVCREFGVSEQTYHRWRNQFGGLKADDAKRLKDLERENSTLKRLLAEAELEKAALGDRPGHSYRSSSSDCGVVGPQGDEHFAGEVALLAADDLGHCAAGTARSATRPQRTTLTTTTTVGDTARSATEPQPSTLPLATHR